MRPLELVTTEDLVKELLQRYDHCVISGVSNWEAPAEGEEYATIAEDGYYKGSFHVNLGLCSRMMSRLNNDFEAKMEERE